MKTSDHTNGIIPIAAALIDTAMPIIHNDQILAFVMFGQIKDLNLDKKQTDELLNRLSKELRLSEQALRTSYEPLKALSPDVIQSTARILYAATLSLFPDKTIDLTENKLITAINEYLITNIQNSLSVPVLCDEFRISKNRLYSLWKKHFNLPIGDYILRLRMEKAKELLTNDDDKFNQVCIKVGIPDYNYFSKVFKSYFGISPREYRKRFPLVLEEK